MPNKEKNSLYSQILAAIVIAIVAGSTTPWWWPEIKSFFGAQDTEIKDSIKPKEDYSSDSKCAEPWKWDAISQKCIMEVVIPAKSFSIPLETAINKVEGRIDFYTNVERLPNDSQNNAVYKNHTGAVQVVIPIMLGNRMVGSQYEVIYSTNKGSICKLSSLPETTGWLKKMRVAYSIRLDTDCNNNGDFCQTSLVQSGKRVHIKTNEFTVTIGEDCN
ncbi:hypothetical protein [Urechidicola croceus]|uniref:Uncharacterized protein n=1 Tax=Urechidicola croceus TaxID=1850246 RepID=A0A1D8P924_9FLAO|nr:hypothetical protein [Urechidicola croceus]AOW21039.1 hypothetical protein LPB138_10260 [Urechidicola croceus]